MRGARAQNRNEASSAGWTEGTRGVGVGQLEATAARARRWERARQARGAACVTPVGTAAAAAPPPSQKSAAAGAARQDAALPPTSRRAGGPSHLWHRAASGSPHQPAHNRGLRAGPAEAHRSRRRSRATLLGGACPCVWRATPQPASCRPSSEGAGARARRQQRQGRAVSRARARPAEGPGERQTWPADESDEELPSRGVERQKAERRLRVRLASWVELHNSVGVRQSPLGLGHLAH